MTDLLRERNELVIEVELPPLAYADEQQLRPDRAGLAGGVIGEVRLEIFPPRRRRDAGPRAGARSLDTCGFSS